MQWREGATRLFIASRRLVLVLAVLARYLEVVGLPPFVSVVLHTSLSVSRYRFVSVVMVFLSSSDLHVLVSCRRLAALVHCSVAEPLPLIYCRDPSSLCRVVLLQW